MNTDKGTPSELDSLDELVTMSQFATRADYEAHKAQIAALPKTPEPPSLTRIDLRRLVDHVWQTAYEDESVPATAFADRMIDHTLASRAEPPALEVQGEPSPLPVHPTERSGEAVQRAADEDRA